MSLFRHRAGALMLWLRYPVMSYREASDLETGGGTQREASQCRAAAELRPRCET